MISIENVKRILQRHYDGAREEHEAGQRGLKAAENMKLNRPAENVSLDTAIRGRTRAKEVREIAKDLEIELKVDELL